MTEVPLFAAPAPKVTLSRALEAHKLAKGEKVTYTSYRAAKTRVQCAECVNVLHEAGGRGWSINSATVARKEGSGGRLLLCSPHAEAWKVRDGVSAAAPKRARGRGRR